jgi:hypothetical protein
LAKKKAKYLKDIADVDRGSPQAISDVQNMEDKARKELTQLDLSFDEQESTAISIPQSDVLLSLSAVYMDPGLLVPHKSDPFSDEDEDDDMDDNEDKKAKFEARKWIERVQGFIFCVYYLCLIRRVYVFYVGHVDKVVYMKPFSTVIL